MSGVLMGHLLNYDQDDANVAPIMTNLAHSKQMFQISGPFSSLQIDSSSKQSAGELVSYEIFLLKGLFSCTRYSAFVCMMNDNREKTFLNFSFGIVLHSLEKQGELQYHGFQVLRLWWLKVQQTTKFDNLEVGEGLLLNDGVYVQKTLKALFNHWDSPISGVPTIVLDIFTIMVKCLQKVCKIKGRESPLLLNLVNDLVQLSASIKGKYNFISVLVNELGAQLILKEYPEFLKGMTPLLSVNHLCPAVSRTYKAIVASTVKNGDEDGLWSGILAPGLMEALLSPDPVIRVNASIYWLPIHLKTIPLGYAKLMTAVNSACKGKPEECLLADVAISKVARKENLICIQSVEERIIQSSFASFNDSVRAEAFLLVCCNTKLSEEVSQLEMELIRTHLPLNMNSDSATFRQQLVYAIRCFTERIRDSVVSHKKKTQSVRGKKETENYEERCDEMLTFLLKVCVQSLHPLFSYQRKKSAIDIFSSLFATLIDCEKSLTYESRLQDEENWKVLMELLLDNVPEIRNQSLNLLVKYFLSPQEDVLEKYTSLAYSLCTSPRAQDNEKGAAVFEYLINTRSESEDAMPRSSSLLMEIVCKLEHEVLEMKKNILRASRHSPAHGWMLALTKCLKSIKDPHKLGKFLETADEICNLTIDLTKYILKTVFGHIDKDTGELKEVEVDGSDNLGMSVDFCEMTDRIHRLVIENHVTTTRNDDILLSEDHEAILASCWLCLLRGGSLLAILSKLKSKMSSNADICTKICNCFVLILSSCRHRGAIEGCFESFLLTCKTLLLSHVKEYQNIPYQIVLDVCNGLVGSSHSGSNTTRRSAGIPLVIEAVVVAEVSLKNEKLFHKAMKTVIALSREVHELKPQDSDENFDLPQIHGLYILKHLFRNSRLGSRVLFYAADVLQIAIKCLSSPIWVARNAATHLFGAVVNRIMGQKNIDGAYIDSLEGSVSSSEFFSRFPDLVSVILNELKLSIPNARTSQHWTLPKPGVHPILSLLSKLTNGKHSSCNISQELIEILKTLLGNPAYSIRCMAAKSLIGLISQKTAVSIAINLCDASDGDSFKNCNNMHGNLVFLKAVTTMYTLASSQVETVFGNVLEILTTQAFHSIVANECLEILSNFRDLLSTSTVFIQYARKHFISVTRDTVAQAGMDKYLKTLASIALDVSTTRDALQLFEGLISSNVPSQQKAALDWVRKTPPGGTVRSSITKILTEFLVRTGPNEVNGEAVEILYDCIELWAAIPNHELEVSKYDYLCQLALGWTSHYTPLSLRCVSMTLLSSVLVCMGNLKNSGFPSDSARKNISCWTDIVSVQTSYHEASEPLRLWASQSLEAAGRVVLPSLRSTNLEKYGQLVCATLSLLHDEQPEIRLPACSFVSRLVKTNHHDHDVVLHQNIATKEFLTLVFKESSCDTRVLNAVFHYCLHQQKPSDSKSRQALLFDKEPFNLYEEPVELAKTVEETFLNLLKRCTSLVSPSYIGGKLEEASVQASQILPERNLTSLQCLSIHIRMLLQAARTLGLRMLPLEESLQKVINMATKENTVG